MSRKVVIVGAGMVGLATAWFLQEEDVQVTVLDETGVAAGSSWGNAGWAAPALTLPLTDPSILASGIRAVLSRSSPVYVPPTLNPRLLKFLILFARNCTPHRFKAAIRLFVEANTHALDVYEQMSAAVPGARLKTADPFIAAFKTAADRRVLIEEFEHVSALGGDLHYEQISGAAARRAEPLLGDAIDCGVFIRGQRFIDPGNFVHALADSVRQRGGIIREGVRVESVDAGRASAPSVVLRGGESVAADTIVLASGTWLGELARPFGVRTIVQAGRGYSFTVMPEQAPVNPIYFPTQRVACTPLDKGLRVAGMMEFKKPDAPLDPRRVSLIVDAARPMLSGIDWSARTDEWVGSRPCTPDGLPLVGRSKNPNVYIAGGHGMWGVALGPLTGRLLARQITHDERPSLLDSFDPLR